LLFLLTRKKKEAEEIPEVEEGLAEGEPEEVIEGEELEEEVEGEALGKEGPESVEEPLEEDIISEEPIDEDLPSSDDEIEDKEL
jgi:hypothetical protein